MFFHKKTPIIIDNQGFSLFLVRNDAEKEGFEPPDLLQSTVFKTAAFDRSAISPVKRALSPWDIPWLRECD